MFELGQKVECSGYMYPLKKSAEGCFLEKSWHRNNKKIDGVIVGVRTLKEGLVYLGGYDEGPSFRPRRHIRTYLVASDLRTTYYVLPQDITARGEVV